MGLIIGPLNRKTLAFILLAFIFSFISLVGICLPSISFFDNLFNLQQIVIEGTGYAYPLNNHPEIKVKVFYNGNNTPFDSTKTDANGMFHLELILTGVSEPSEDSESRILQNPCKEDPTIQVFCNESKDYKLIVSDMSGRLLLHQSIGLTTGNNRVTIKDIGGSGIKIINISDGLLNKTFRVIQLNNDLWSPQVIISQVNETYLDTKEKKNFDKKSSNELSDSIKLEFTASGYYKLDTVLAIDSYIRADYVIKMIPLAIHDLYIIVKDINGQRIPNFTQIFKLENGTDKQYTTDANGVLHYLELEYGTPSTKLKVTDISTKYNNAQIYRKTNHSLADTNYCQTQKFDGLPQFAELSLTNLPDTLVKTKFPQNVEVPAALKSTYGDSIPITHPVIRGLMGERFANNMTKLTSTPARDTIEIIQYLFNSTTSAPIPQAQIDRARAELNKVLAIYTLDDGTKLLNYKMSTINSIADPIWQAVLARGGDNTAYTMFYNGSPYNGVGLTFADSPNGKARIKYCYSEYSTGSTTGGLHEEMYQQFTNNDDPAIGSTSTWTYNNSTGQISEFGKIMGRVIYFFNQGTPTK
jgi:hypothetical protein